MGILNRTPDSFYDRGATYELDALYARAEQLVSEGADILDVGGSEGRPRARGRRGGGARSCRAGGRRPAGALRHARLGRHMAGLGRPGLLCAGRGDGQRHQRTGRPRLCRWPRRSTVPRWSPRTSGSPPGWPIPSRSTTTSSPRWPPSCWSGRARRTGRHPSRAHRPRRRARPGEDGRAVAHPPARLVGPGRSRLPAPALRVEQDVPRQDPGSRTDRASRASIGAAALGIAWGCRIVRAHDVEGTCRVRDAAWRRSARRGVSAKRRRARRSEGRGRSPRVDVSGPRGRSRTRGPGSARAGLRAGGRSGPCPRRRGARRRGRGSERRSRRRRLPHPAFLGRPPGGGRARRRPPAHCGRAAPGRGRSAIRSRAPCWCWSAGVGRSRRLSCGR